MFVRICLFISLLCMLLTTQTVSAKPLRIAAASNFKLALSQIVQQYQQQTGQQITISSASSGILYQQIKLGAPFDVFLSADENKTDLLIADGLAQKASKQIYAIGQLVFYGPSNANYQQLDQFTKLVIANPLHAPYGIAAQQLMTEIVPQQYQGTLITTNNVASAFQLVHSKNAPAGFVALSHIKAANVSSTDYQIINSPTAQIAQAGVVLNASSQPLQAQAFLTYLSQPVAQDIIERFGYRVK